MPWGRLDDTFHRHPKRLAVSLAADGLVARAISYCAEYLTDGYVPEQWLLAQIPRRQRKALVAELTAPLPPRGNPLFEIVDGGYHLHDYLEHNQSREEVERLRAKDTRKKALQRNRQLLSQVRVRDADHCRYCDCEIDWRDRRGPTSGTYDHVDPRGENVAGNVVVACRQCNGLKGGRTPEEANMPLLAPRGAQLEWLPGAGPSPGTNQKNPQPPASGVEEEPQPTEEQPEDHAPAPDDLRSRFPWPLGEVLEVLSKVERWAQAELYAAGLQSVIDANPGRPAVKGAHLTAARGNDPGFRTQSPIKAFGDVMRTLDPAEDKPAGSTGQNVLRIDRRCPRCKVREVESGYGAYCEQCSEELAS